MAGDVTGPHLIPDAQHAPEDAGRRRPEDPLGGMTSHLAGDAGIGQCRTLRDDSAERMPAHRLDHGMRVTAGDETGAQGDDGWRIGDGGPEVTLGEDGVDQE